MLLVFFSTGFGIGADPFAQIADVVFLTLNRILLTSVWAEHLIFESIYEVVFQVLICIVIRIELTCIIYGDSLKTDKRRVVTESFYVRFYNGGSACSCVIFLNQAYIHVVGANDGVCIG